MCDANSTTAYQKFLTAHTLKRRAEQLVNELNALFKDARELGQSITLSQKERSYPSTPYGTYEYYLSSSTNNAEGEMYKVFVKPINIGV